MNDRPVTGEQVERIIARALELEQEGPMLDQEQLREIAREVNISSTALARATQEVLARSDPAPAPKNWRSRLVAGIEAIGCLVGGFLSGGLLAGGFPAFGVTALFLMGILLASRRDRSSIARLFAQWVTLAGMFAVTAELLGTGLSVMALAALFAGGGLVATAIAWLQDQGQTERAESDQPMLPGDTTEPA